MKLTESGGRSLTNWRLIDGWLDEDEAHLLKKYSPNKTVLELGSYKGKSSVVILQSQPKSLICVDTFDGRATNAEMNTEKEFLENVGGFKNVTHYKTTTDSFFELRQYVNYFDVVYVDADHSYEQCKKDVENSIHVLKSNGIIILHDALKPRECSYHPHPGVLKVYEELLNDKRFSKVETVNRIAVFRLNNENSSSEI